MRLKRNYLTLCWCLLCAIFSGSTLASTVPTVEKIMQSGFPAHPEALAKMNDELFAEYVANKNVTSLIFYAYGILRLAEHYSTANDFIHAYEYARTGFFYLDEAVDSHEDNLLVRYLRARVDAYTAGSGRCVVTLKDTAIMLEQRPAFNTGLIEHINAMRYRALKDCQEPQKANEVLAQLRQQNPGAADLLISDTAPIWDMNEVTQVLIPMVKGN
ncbi:hypothetical protein [Leclercia sp. M50]|uniref:hypothetical protein n=1 Tax=Leclercia sp. M50 TaxID=3081258 RepID=UPI003019B087